MRCCATASTITLALAQRLFAALGVDLHQIERGGRCPERPSDVEVNVLDNHRAHQAGLRDAFRVKAALARRQSRGANNGI
jgi:hypothetical protein